jgi:hypothetical protein
MKQIKLIIACIMLAGSLLSINYDSYEEVEQKELMKVFNDEKAVEQFLEDMKTRKPIVREEPLPNRNLDTEMVIITSEEFVDDFENFAQLKNEEGIVTEIISTNTTGLTASQIRNWLTIQKVYFPALTYVLIGGDENIVPIWSIEYLENGESYPATTDFYYSNVLSTWPADNDIMEIELEPDLYVGRVPVRNASEIYIFYNKYQNYRTNYTDNTDRMAFIATNVQKYPGAMADNICIDQIMDNLDANIETDVLYNYDLVDEENGCAKPILDMFYDRDYSFLYGMWHAGASQYAIFDSEYNRNNEWFENNFDNHNQSITIVTIAVDEGRCWYSDKILSGPHINQYKYYYSRPAENYYQLEDELHTSFGSSYVAWIGACHSANLETDRWSSTIPVQRGIGDTIVMNYDISGERYPYWVNSVPDTVYNDENCISEVFFNELGGPIAINTSSTIDFPYFSNKMVEEYFDLQFDDGYSKLGYLTRESWDRVSNWLDTSRVLRELYFGYTLFGDPSMDVWSAKAEQLVTILDHGGIGLEFTALNSSGVEVDAEIVVTNSSGIILGKGNSPYTYSGRIESTSVITSNAPNYIQARNTYSELEDYTGLPYSMTFENGIDYNWEMHSSNIYGRTLVTDQYTPHGGNKHLIMDCKRGTFTTNEAWLHLDLTDEDRVELNFWWKEFNDETHTTDGVYFSDDGGTNFTKVYSLSGGSITWQEITLDVDALSTYYSLDYSNNFVIKFQQYDNSSITNDGFAFDDISVYSVYVDDLPYSMGFNTISMGEYWTTESSNNYGRIQITGQNLPYEGRGHLTMDSNTALHNVTNSALLYLNLSQYNDPELTFWWKEFKDDTHTTDGVYFSDDAGENFTKVYSLTGTLNNTWEEIELDIATLASTYELDLSSHFVIKFQQYDDCPITGYMFDSDGFAFDDLTIINDGGGSDSGIDDNEVVSNGFLLSNHPNPFNPTTAIFFSIPENGNVVLSIYNIKGQIVKLLVKESFESGSHSLVWDGNDDTGNSVCSGVYFYKLNVNGKTESVKKMLLLK